jgi:flavin reductase (DIM6/NTAB) family NADH-FMN oxidoreductase RutF
MTVEPRALRDAMGCFATGVTVVSTLTGDNKPVGITVNSFNSVSLDPPLVLFSLDRNANHLQTFLDAGSYAINVLSEDQEAISNGFARSGDSYFGEAPHRMSDLGCPVLDGALACFECETENTFDGGDHVIFVGRVRRVSHNTFGDPLLYYRGNYSAVRNAD